MGKRNREEREKAYDEAYQKFRFTAVPSSGRPGSPHRYFAASYQALHQDAAAVPVLRIHRHVNNLCIVTTEHWAKQQNHSGHSAIRTIAMQQEVASKSASEKKKLKQRASQETSSSTKVGVVKPNDILCTVTTKEETKVEIPCAIAGTVVELNSQLTAQQLEQDPLFSGYLAVILPSGPFPPKNQLIDTPEPATKIDPEDNQEVRQEQTQTKDLSRDEL